LKRYKNFRGNKFKNQNNLKSASSAWALKVEVQQGLIVQKDKIKRLMMRQSMNSLEEAKEVMR